MLEMLLSQKGYCNEFWCFWWLGIFQTRWCSLVSAVSPANWVLGNRSVVVRLANASSSGPLRGFQCSRQQPRFHVAFGLTTQIEHHLFPGIGSMACKGLDRNLRWLFMTCAQKRIRSVCGGHCDVCGYAVQVAYAGVCQCYLHMNPRTSLLWHLQEDYSKGVCQAWRAAWLLQIDQIGARLVSDAGCRTLAGLVLLSLLISPDDWEDWRVELPHTNFGWHFQGTIRMFLPPQPSGGVLTESSQLFRCPQCTLSQRSVLACSDSVVIVTLWPFVSNSLAHCLA